MAATLKPSRRTTALREWSAPAPAGSPLRVDRAAGVIFGVKVLGFRSRNNHGLKEAENGTEYTRGCMEAALPLYEGVDVLVDHDGPGSKPRSAHDVFGKLKGVRLAGDGIRADLHYLRSHALADRVAEDVERGLGAYGLSHDARAGRERFDPAGKRLVIESLSAVHSVDLVRRPATNRNLWESVPMKLTLRELLAQLKLTPNRGAWRKRLLEADGMPGMDTPVDAPPDLPADPAPADADQALKDGFKAAMTAVLDDESMSAADKLKRLKELLMTHEKLTGAAEPATPVEEGMDEYGGKKADDDKTEAVKQVAVLKHKLAVRQLADDLGVRGDKVLLEAAEALPTVDAARKLLEREKARGGGPRANGFGGGTRAGTGTAPADAKAFAASIKD